jgi:hypothetical protein
MSSQQLLFLCGMWSLWRTHNNIKHGKNTIPVRKAINWALDTVTQLLAHTRPTIEKSRRQHIKWRPPPLGVMKVNVDAAFNNNSATGSIGAIMRDEAGHFQAAGAWFLDSVASVMVAEAEACRQGLQLAKDAGATSIIIETDSKLVVDLWQSMSTNRSKINHILCDIETRSLYFSFLIVNVYREVNLGAHACAKEASSIMFQNMWMHVSLNFLLHIVHDDCSLMNDE